MKLCALCGEKKEYIALLSEYFHTTAIRYGIVKMAISGSVSRNEQKEDSDIDIAYEGEPDIFTRIRMKRELEQLFKCKVDIIRLSKQVTDSIFDENISKDLLYV